MSQIMLNISESFSNITPCKQCMGFLLPDIGPVQLICIFQPVKKLFRWCNEVGEVKALELDQVHRALGPRSSDLNNPCEIICHLHRYVYKEDIVRKAWRMETIDFNGANIKILLDLSKPTLQHQGLLRPLLDRLWQLGHTYRWRFPFASTTWKVTSSFIINRQADLPELFAFLEIPPFPVLDWHCSPVPSISNDGNIRPKK